MGRFTSMIKKFNLCKIALFFIVLLWIFPQTILAQDVKKIILLHFDIHSKTNTVFLQESIYKGLSSELTKSKYIQFIDRSLFSKTIEDKRIDEKLAISIEIPGPIM